MDTSRIAQPDYKNAYAFIYSNYGRNDYIISVSNGALYSYYVKNLSCDQEFLFYNTEDKKFDSYRDWAKTSLSLWSYKNNGELKDIYNSCDIIQSKDEFTKKFGDDIIAGKFWFIVDKKQYLDPLMQDSVYKNCEETDFYQVYVYSCDKKILLSLINT